MLANIIIYYSSVNFGLLSSVVHHVQGSFLEPFLLIICQWHCKSHQRQYSMSVEHKWHETLCGDKSSDLQDLQDMQCGLTSLLLDGVLPPLSLKWAERGLQQKRQLGNRKWNVFLALCVIVEKLRQINWLCIIIILSFFLFRSYIMRSIITAIDSKGNKKALHFDWPALNFLERCLIF